MVRQPSQCFSLISHVVKKFSNIIATLNVICLGMEATEEVILAIDMCECDGGTLLL